MIAVFLTAGVVVATQSAGVAPANAACGQFSKNGKNPPPGRYAVLTNCRSYAINFIISESNNVHEVTLDGGKTYYSDDPMATVISWKGGKK